jgi:hypothetical protein
MSCAAAHQLRSQNVAGPIYTDLNMNSVLCKIWGFHGCDYEECRLLRCGALWGLVTTDFSGNMSSPSSGWNPRSLILSSLEMEVTHFSEKSVLTRPTGSHVSDDGILNSALALSVTRGMAGGGTGGCSYF